MGTPKALVPLSPVMTMLDRAISVMSQALQAKNANQIVLSLPHDAFLSDAFSGTFKAAQEDYPPEDFPGLSWLPDDADTYNGPMQGIAIVAQRFPNRPLLVMCVDQIAIKPSLLKMLLPENQDQATDIAAFLCDGLAPFPVYLSSQASEAVAQAFEDGERSLSHWLSEQQSADLLPVQAIPLSVQEMFALASANTLQELAGIQNTAIQEPKNK
jgi:molybdopterin-guanine dinucleotide biosynthesis protein A